eukprot:PITA_08782
MDEGKLLGHIISKDGIRIDPARVEAIQQIDLPWNKKEIQSFNDTEGRRGKWIAALLEYDVEIKPIKLVKGQGLAMLIAESNLHALDIILWLLCPMRMRKVRQFRIIEFCNKYKIILGHSTAYHPQGNGLAESSNKSLVNIIKKLLEINKKSWHKKLVNALWAYRVSQKKSIGMSPFELVYGVDTVFATSLAAPVVKLLQEAGSEDDPMQRRLNQMIHLQQTGEEVFQNTFKLQEKIKKIYDRKAKADKFQLDDVVLKWDARNKENGKHGKLKNLWKGPFKTVAYRGYNAFLMKEMNGDDCPGGPVNGRLLKRYHF